MTDVDDLEIILRRASYELRPYLADCISLSEVDEFLGRCGWELLLCGGCRLLEDCIVLTLYLGHFHSCALFQLGKALSNKFGVLFCTHVRVKKII